MYQIALSETVKSLNLKKMRGRGK